MFRVLKVGGFCYSLVPEDREDCFLLCSGDTATLELRAKTVASPVTTE